VPRKMRIKLRAQHRYVEGAATCLPKTRPNNEQSEVMYGLVWPTSAWSATIRIDENGDRTRLPVTEEIVG
jgi:hypothetical protein